MNAKRRIPTVAGHVRGKLLRATVAVFLLTAAAVLSVVGWLHGATEAERLAEMEHEVTTRIASKASALVDNHAVALTGLVADNALSDVQALVRRTVDEDVDLIYGLFVDQDGKPWAYATRDSRGVPLDPSAIRKRWLDVPALGGGWSVQEPTQRRALLGGVEVFEVGRPVVDGDELLGRIHYGFSTEPLARALASVRAKSETTRKRLLAWLSASVIISTLIGALTMTRAARRITKPLAELTHAANEIANGELGVRVQVSSKDELELLASAFNQMQSANEQAMERLRTAMDQALEASRLKSEFLANMSHEIRTPMNGVIGMLKLMLRMPLDSKLRRYAETADTSASALMTIINDVLDFSKMEAGKYELQSVPFDPRAVLQEVAELFAGRAYEKAVELACHAAVDVPQRVTGDPDRYRQVLSNLVGNAVKFTATGEVYVELTVDQKDEEKCVLRTVVSDTGIGIAPEDQGKLFDAFSQVDGSMMREYGGTGLGLAICKRLTEMMNGRIGVTSERGAGSRFWMTIQVGASASPSRPSCVELPVGKRAILVESSQRWSRIVETHMKEWGLSCECFQDGVPALERLREQASERRTFDVMVLGAQLRDMPIDRFVRQLRELPTGARLPLIVLSQLGTSAALSEVEGEIAAQVAKPIRMSELYDRVVGAFTGRVAGRTPMPERSRPARSAPNGLSILIVDDNEINRFVATEHVEQAGYLAVTANNGAEAVAAVKSREFAAVLMDCQMPVLDGYSATVKIRKWEAGQRHVPIIALTAHALPGERDKVRAAGMDDYLSKPLRADSLERTLRRHVRLALDPPASSRVQPTATAAAEHDLEADMPRSPKLARLFLEQMPGQLSSLEEAISREDLALLRERAHKVKGGCLALGAQRMAKVAEALQHADPGVGFGALQSQTLVLRELFERLAVLLATEHPDSLPRPARLSGAPRR